MAERQIIAMGGGGFSMEPDNLALDRYILAQTAKENPVVCFVPTASGDSKEYIARFRRSFATLPCQPRYLSLFEPPADLEAFVAECDVIYVGGGNTRNLMALWREWGLGELLHGAWERGVVLCGISAGAMCWFEHGLTDSARALAPIECLGFLKGSCNPHYDGEAARRPTFHSCILHGTLPTGYGLDDGAAVHFIGEELAHVVTSRGAARAYRVSLENGDVWERELPALFLENFPAEDRRSGAKVTPYQRHHP